MDEPEEVSRARTETWDCAATMARLALASAHRGNLDDAIMWLEIIAAGSSQDCSHDDRVPTKEGWLRCTACGDVDDGEE